MIARYGGSGRASPQGWPTDRDAPAPAESAAPGEGRWPAKIPICHAPKTEKGKRYVVLPPLAIATIRAALLWKKEQRLKLGEKFNEAGTLFCDPKGRALRAGNLRRRDHEPRCTRFEILSATPTARNSKPPGSPGPVPNGSGPEIPARSNGSAPTGTPRPRNVPPPLLVTC